MTELARPPGLTLTNWDLGGPISQWSYRHADRLFPTCALTPGTRVTAECCASDASVLEVVRGDLDSGLVSGITIIHGGRVVSRWPDGPHERHLLWSVSKVVASLAVGLLVDQGKIDLEVPVRHYIPELDRSWDPCLLRHVLDMSSGVVCPEAEDPDAYRNAEHPFYRFEASLGFRPTRAPTSPYEFVAQLPRAGTPGGRYAYTSVNTFLLAWVVERVSRASYAAALQELIWSRLALSDDSAICVNRTGAPVAHAGIMMSTDDLARFGTVFTATPPDAAWTPTDAACRLTVPAGYVSMLRAPRAFSTTPALDWPRGSRPAGQWDCVAPDGDLFKGGFGGQGLYVSPSADVVIAFCGVPNHRGDENELRRSCIRLRDQVIRGERGR